MDGRRIGLLIAAVATLGWVVLGAADPPHLHQLGGRPLAALNGVPGGATVRSLPDRTGRLSIPPGWTVFSTRPGAVRSQVRSPWYRGGTNVVVVTASSNARLRQSLVVEGGGRSQTVYRPPAASAQQQVRIRVAGLHRFRLVGTVWHPGPAWMLFSAPYEPRAQTWDRLGDAGRTLLTAIAILTLLLGPGLVLFRRVSLLTVALPGLLILCGIGTVVWIAAGLSRVDSHNTGWPNAAAAAMVGVVAAGIAVGAVLRPLPAMSPPTSRVLAIYALLVFVVAGKGMWAPGPSGETFGGTVTRTLEIGPRSDPRLPYAGALSVLDGLSPTNVPRTDGFGFGAGWTLGDRGPGAAVYAAPIVAAAGAVHLQHLPEMPWQPVDPQGYFAYRIGMGAANLLVVPVLAGIAGAFRGRRGMLLGAAFAGLTPFVVHEGFYTWPKFLAAMWVLLAGYAALRRRPMRAGLCLLAGFLTHPLALLWAPSIGLLWLYRAWRARRDYRVLAGQAVGLVGIVAAGVGGWALGSHVPGHRSTFLTYFGEVDLVRVHTAGVWLHGRVESLANTLVPGWLPTHYAHNIDMNAIYGPTSGGLHWLLQYWATLPFGFGIAGLPLLVISLLWMLRRFPAIFVMAVFLPFLLFTIYWGAAITGMLREGLHPWVATLLICCAVAAAGESRWWRILALLSCLRVVGVVAVLIGPVLADHHSLVMQGFTVTDICALILMLGSVFSLFLLCTGAVWNSASPSAVESPTFGGFTRRRGAKTMKFS